MQSRVEGAENLLPTMHAMKSQTESYCNKARLEVNKDIKRGDEKNQQQIMKIWEKISQEQEQKFEARIQSLEKLHATQSANLVRRVDELHKENGNLRAELFRLSALPSGRMPEIVINNPPPQVTFSPPEISQPNLATPSVLPDFVEAAHSRV